MYIRSLAVTNLRSVAKGKLEFVYPGRESADDFIDVPNWPPKHPNVNVLLGINGAGKSTVLDAIALSAMAPVISSSSGYHPYALIRRTAKGAENVANLMAEVVIHAQDVGVKHFEVNKIRTIRASVERRGSVETLNAAEGSDPIWDGMFQNDQPAFLMVGYGATRRVDTNPNLDVSSRMKARQLRYDRVASLFEDQYTLLPLASWLPEWRDRNPGRYKQVVGLINKLSHEGVRFTEERENGEYLFKVGNNVVPFSAMSDGYKAYIGWVGDLLYHVCMGAPDGKKLVDNKGVVLVDEIDLHIHPEWQRTMIPTLASALPNLQFIFTSHSPLVVGTLERVNVIHVKLDTQGRAIIKRPEDEVYGLSADQILRSEMFGLESTRAPAFKAHLDALTKAASEGDREATRQFMRQAAKGAGAADVPTAEASPNAERAMPEWLKSVSGSTASTHES